MRCEVTRERHQARLFCSGRVLHELVHEPHDLKMLLVEVGLSHLCSLCHVDRGPLYVRARHFSCGDLVEETERREHEFLLLGKMRLDDDKRPLRHGGRNATPGCFLCETIDE